MLIRIRIDAFLLEIEIGFFSLILGLLVGGFLHLPGWEEQHCGLVWDQVICDWFSPWVFKFGEAPPHSPQPPLSPPCLVESPGRLFAEWVLTVLR